MWYFAWFLGVGFAVLLAVVNALWYESRLAVKSTDKQD